MSKEFIFEFNPDNYLDIYSIAKSLCLHHRQNIGDDPIIAINIQFTNKEMEDRFMNWYLNISIPLYNGEGIKDRLEDI